VIHLMASLKNFKVKSLDINLSGPFPNLTSDGIARLYKTVGRFKTIEILDLNFDWNNSADGTVNILISQLANLNHLKLLALNFSGVVDSEAKYANIYEILANCQQINALDIRDSIFPEKESSL